MLSVRAEGGGTSAPQCATPSDATITRQHRLSCIGRGCEHLDPPEGLFSNVPPKFVRPCIPTTAKKIPHGDTWLHEPKLDGYRFQIVAAWANGLEEESAQ